MFVCREKLRCERGFEMYRTLDTPSRRAAFIHFLVSEVHPFADGNGRVPRMMMNAEKGFREGGESKLYKDLKQTKCRMTPLPLSYRQANEGYAVPRHGTGGRR